MYINYMRHNDTSVSLPDRKLGCHDIPYAQMPHQWGLQLLPNGKYSSEAGGLVCTLSYRVKARLRKVMDPTYLGPPSNVQVYFCPGGDDSVCRPPYLVITWKAMASWTNKNATLDLHKTGAVMAMFCLTWGLRRWYYINKPQEALDLEILWTAIHMLRSRYGPDVPWIP
jgi:hypothetical protein